MSYLKCIGHVLMDDQCLIKVVNYQIGYAVINKKKHDPWLLPQVKLLNSLIKIHIDHAYMVFVPHKFLKSIKQKHSIFRVFSLNTKN